MSSSRHLVRSAGPPSDTAPPPFFQGDGSAPVSLPSSRTIRDPCWDWLEDDYLDDDWGDDPESWQLPTLSADELAWVAPDLTPLPGARAVGQRGQPHHEDSWRPRRRPCG